MRARGWEGGDSKPRPEQRLITSPDRPGLPVFQCATLKNPGYEARGLPQRAWYPTTDCVCVSNLPDYGWSHYLMHISVYLNKATMYYALCNMTMLSLARVAEISNKVRVFLSRVYWWYKVDRQTTRGHSNALWWQKFLSVVAHLTQSICYQCLLFLLDHKLQWVGRGGWSRFLIRSCSP